MALVEVTQAKTEVVVIAPAKIDISLSTHEAEGLRELLKRGVTSDTLISLKLHDLAILLVNKVEQGSAGSFIFNFEAEGDFPR